MGSEDRQVSILITGDGEIQKLNRQYRKKDKATDVLSFPSPAAAPFDSCLGDIVISIETARRQAREFGHSVSCEFKRLITHGYLHLLGFDHENVPPAKAAKMRRTEERLLKLL